MISHTAKSRRSFETSGIKQGWPYGNRNQRGRSRASVRCDLLGIDCAVLHAGPLQQSCAQGYRCAGRRDWPVRVYPCPEGEPARRAADRDAVL